MGYSCAAISSLVRSEIEKIYAAKGERRGNGIIANGWTGFYERGRENADGAITGTVWKDTEGGYCRKVGPFKIAANGRIVRFPGLSANEKKSVEAAAKVEYDRIYPDFPICS